MSFLPVLRIIWYIAVIAMHVSNIFYMRWFRSSRPVDPKDNHLENFRDLEYRFFTSWTFILQIIYSFYGLGCDLFILKNSKKKDYSLPTPVSDFREILFSGLMWPCSMVVASIFWGLYAYDRDLIFPKFLDNIIPPISNHVIHTMIVPVVLFEVAFRPRFEPETHARNVMQLTMHLCVYLSVLYFTYIEKGIWLYPIFKKLFGTIYFGVAILAAAVLFYTFYYIQWPLTRLIHGSKKNLQNKKAKLEKKLK
ncbi:androgen-dependent TFPI-regulating protein-like [Trichoplusia ni]|uniref:Androgen-dependent TFPI-regulating protein-like n=1 Tax=Trichoplusia ni TaxID=7111 RepID=A0A7E5WN63_TRINI|nr:androgen-dependent TFPI-regulating protein-like [Trichoplusia ni]